MPRNWKTGVLDVPSRVATKRIKASAKKHLDEKGRHTPAKSKAARGLASRIVARHPYEKKGGNFGKYWAGSASASVAKSEKRK